MKITRGRRIILELLGPSFVATLLVFLCFALLSAWTTVQTGKLPPLEKALPLFGSIGAAMFVFGFIPSLAYTTIMEWKFENGLCPKSWQAVWVATCSFGSLAWIPAILFCHLFLHWDIMFLWILVGLGLLDGFLLGLLIKYGSTANTRTGEPMP